MSVDESTRNNAAQKMMSIQCEQQFVVFDTDGSGTLNYDELVMAMQALHSRVGLDPPTSDKIKKALTKFDTNHDGVLNLDEFQDLYCQLMQKASKPRLAPPLSAMKKQSMQMFDAIATDGKLGKQEFVTITQSMLKPMMMMAAKGAAAQACQSIPFGPDVLPAFERATENFDLAGLAQILALIHETVDKDRNGTLERSEVKAIWDLIALCISGEKVVDEMGNDTQIGNQMQFVIKMVWQLIDKDGNGKITLDEVTGLLEKLIRIIGAFAKAAFESLDVIVSSSEVQKPLSFLAGPSGPMGGAFQMIDSDGDGTISREEFTAFMAQVGPGLKGPVTQMMMMVGAVGDQNPGLITALKNIREALAETQNGFYNKLRLKAAEWSSGGVDEANFLIATVPIFKEQLADQSKIDQKSLQSNVQQIQQIVQAYMTRTPMPYIVEEAEAFQNNPEIMKINMKVQESLRKKMAAFAPDLMKNIFRLLDMDGSGKISSRELNVVKAMIDGFLRLGGSAFKDAMSAEDQASMKEMYPDLFEESSAPQDGDAQVDRIVKEMTAMMMALFDVLDRDGNGTLEVIEIVGFIQSLASFFACHIKIMMQVMVETFVEMEKEMLQLLWTKLGIEEVSPEEVPQVAMSLVMLAASAAPQQ